MTPDCPRYFEFESDFVASLRCIPMQVRYKLDTCGVKLKLNCWHRFTAAERQACVELPCGTPDEVAAYRDRLQERVTHHMGSPAKTLAIDPHPPWLVAIGIPETVAEKAKSFGVQLEGDRWAALVPLQRFALIKLSRPSHENRNFYAALGEFGLLGSAD